MKTEVAMLAALSVVGASGCCKTRCYSTPQNHRPVEVMCAGPTVHPPDPEGGSFIPGPDGGDDCERDSDCPRYDPDAGPIPGKGLCSCAPNTRGFAGMSWNTCIDSNCRTDADCAGGYCSPSVDLFCGTFYGVEGYYCHTPQDTCLNDCDCGDGGYCAYSTEVGYWYCGYGTCAG